MFKTKSIAALITLQLFSACCFAIPQESCVVLTLEKSVNGELSWCYAAEFNDLLAVPVVKSLPSYRPPRQLAEDLGKRSVANGRWTLGFKVVTSEQFRRQQERLKVATELEEKIYLNGGIGLDVISLANSFVDGGGYDKERRGHGVVDDILFEDNIVLASNRSAAGTYCSGFTFSVAMKAAEARQLLKDKSLVEIRNFQRNWFGANAASVEKQSVQAIVDLGIGQEIRLDHAEPGDFLQFWRTAKGNTDGHSAIFLDWVVNDGQRIGFQYRSSQGTTNGIGNRVEYFIGNQRGKVHRTRTYVGRSNVK